MTYRSDRAYRKGGRFGAGSSMPHRTGAGGLAAPGGPPSVPPLTSTESTPPLITTTSSLPPTAVPLPRTPPGIPGVTGLPTPPAFHLPGPRICFSPGPPRALGRPGDLPRDHGAWKNKSCFSRNSKGWKPDILTIGDAHTNPGEKGPQSPDRPPNVSGDRAGYNTRMFRDGKDVARSLRYLGYTFGNDGDALIRLFQQNWNRVVNRIDYIPGRFRDVPFTYVPSGYLSVDGIIGPHTLNALEIALINQRMNAALSWENVFNMASGSNGYGRRNVYNAAQGIR